MIDLKNSQNGFTLIELSIVLLIVGVVVGGIFAGKSIINSAKLRTVITEFRTFKAASDLFKEKYKALPGDYKKAYEHWPDILSRFSNALLVGRLADGNDDGRIRHWPQIDRFTESLMFWGHLNASGFFLNRSWGEVNISGTKPGIHFGKLLLDTPNSVFPFVPNSYAGSFSLPPVKINSPKSAGLDNAGFFVLFSLRSPAWSNAITLVSSNTVVFDDIPNGGALLPKDAQIIDQKMDDGFAASGIIHSRGGAGLAGCTLSSGGEEKYKLSTTTKDCTLYYWFDG